MFKPQDHYFKRAKDDWFVARSIYKLQEIDEKFRIFDVHSQHILDIWCAPWSRLQYAQQQQAKYTIKDNLILWLDLKKVLFSAKWLHTYACDIQDTELVQWIFTNHWIKKFDVIISDMAPNTVGIRNIDAIRSIWLLEKTLWIYEQRLAKNWKFVIKIFMWPWFDEFVSDLKKVYWPSHIRVFKPKACRAESKETYIVKI